MSLTPFAVPTAPLDPQKSASQIRSALNQLVAAVNSSIVTNTGPTAVSTVMTILAAGTGLTYAIVNGRSGTTQSFVDVVVWDPVHGTAVTVLSSTSTGTSAAASRTYALSSGALRLTMGVGTYQVFVYPIVLS